MMIIDDNDGDDGEEEDVDNDRYGLFRHFSPQPISLCVNIIVIILLYHC